MRLFVMAIKDQEVKKEKIVETKKDLNVTTKQVTKVVRATADGKLVQKDSDRKRVVMKRIEQRERFARQRQRDKSRKRREEEFETRLVSIRRVAKTRAGGKRLRLSVMVVIGDRKGRVGIGLAKGRDVKDAEGKAVNRAKKTLAKINLKGQTIPHEIVYKKGAARVFLKPAAPGTGVIAGSAVRAVVEVAGVKDILSKALGTKNVISNVYATFEALKQLRLGRN